MNCPLIHWRRMALETWAEHTLDSSAIALLDALDGDPDLEPEEDDNADQEENDQPLAELWVFDLCPCCGHHTSEVTYV